MGDIRKHAPHIFWSKFEVSILNAHYSILPMNELLEKLPGRSARVIQCKANGLGLVRLKPEKMTIKQMRESKRKHMANKRIANPVAARNYQNSHRAKHKDRINAKTRKETARRIFWARALRLRNGITAQMLAKLWKEQRGRCALSGEKMNRTAEVDHKLPRARGGTDVIQNLQWVMPIPNRAKRDLTDAEFLALCQSCARWIGERIQMIEEATC
jgi:CRISPR/Cas system Type II protein with McrA/HNH and RuvC-like nuclease domain